MRARFAVAGLFLLGALVLALLRTGRPDSSASAAPELAANDRAPPVAELAAVADEMPLEPDPGAAREEAAAPIPTGPIRGQLVEEEGGAPIPVVRIVLLASPGDRVAETLRTEGDGSFTTERAFPRSLVRAWVRDPGTGIVLARHEAPFDPELGEWRIPVPRQASGTRRAAALFEPGESVLHGRVVTHGGRGVEGALVKALPLEGEGAAITETTEEDGGFRLHGLQAQGYRVLALGGFAASAARELVLEEGENQAGELVLPVDDSPGPIRGRLVAEPGGDEPFGVLLLRNVQSGKELAVLTEFELFGEQESDGQRPFEILGVPPGEYELSVVTIDGRRYEPASLRVQPPSEGLEFRARSRLDPYYRFTVRDERSGAPVEGCIALGRTHGQWWGFEIDDPDIAGYERWIVFASGYRAARGGFEHAVPAGTDDEGRALARIEVALARGYAAALVFKDAEGTRLMAPQFGDYFGDGLAGVQVFADGEPATVSDADGLALVELAREPDQLTFQLPGWRVAGVREEEGLRLVQMIRE